MDAWEDLDWETFVAVKIGPHPSLSAAQKAAVAFDYDMVDGFKEQSVRCVLLPYFLKKMNIDQDDLTRETMVQQVVLLNREVSVFKF